MCGLASLETLCGPGNKFKVAPLRLLQQAGQGVDRCRGRPSTQHMLAFCFRLSAISLALSLAPWAWGSGGGAAGKAGSQRCTQIGELTLNLLRTREPMYVQALHMQIHDQPLKRVHAACERRTEAGSTSVFLCSRGCSSAHLGGGLGHVANIFHRLPRLALGRVADLRVGVTPGWGRGGQRRLGASQRARRRRRCAQAVMARLVLCVPKP